MFGIGDAVTAGLQIIDKFIPDPKAKADAIFKLKNLEQEGSEPIFRLSESIFSSVTENFTCEFSRSLFRIH